MILLVEDHVDQLEYLKTSIKRVDSKLELLSATTIQDAELLVEENEISAFFLDIQLPDGSGIEFAKKLRDTKKYHLTPIVFITGLITKELDAFRNTHCYDYIVKPFSYERIVEIIKRLFLDFVDDSMDEKHVILEYKGVRQRLELKEIIYIESRRRKLFIVTHNEVIDYKVMGIPKFLESLDERFVQVHQSFAINRDYIEKTDVPQSLIKMKKIEELIPIGRSYRRKVKEINEFYRNVHII